MDCSEDIAKWKSGFVPFKMIITLFKNSQIEQKTEKKPLRVDWSVNWLMHKTSKSLSTTFLFHLPDEAVSSGFSNSLIDNIFLAIYSKSLSVSSLEIPTRTHKPFWIEPMISSETVTLAFRTLFKKFYIL